MKIAELFEEDIYTSIDDVTFSEEELLEVFRYFLDRLEYDHGNNRQDMIEHHIHKLIRLPYKELLRKMPRGPKGRWQDLMMDIRIELRDRAEIKAARGMAA